MKISNCIASLCVLGTISGVTLAATHADTKAGDMSFTIAVIPDTQNYIDFNHQKAKGYPFDARDLFKEQMQYVADHLKSKGGDIAFVTSVGDVWQHQSLHIDPEHEARGFHWVPNPFLEKELGAPGPEVKAIEMPTARSGYELIAGATPFSVVPGNHDYDSMWTDAAHPPKPVFETMDDVGLLHASGLSNFVSVFGAQSDFFRGKSWYVASHDGGADSAQIFTAGGYRFLHIGLQFDAPNASLEWAASVLKKYPKLPTIISTHDYLDTQGQRLPNPAIDNHRVDSQDNTPQMVWDKLISPNDQIFLVLCGHEHAQAFRTDPNAAGHQVFQILADYQDRAQTVIEAGMKPNRLLGVGDGWMRLMTFDMSGATPSIHVHTYSTHYKKDSLEQAEYASWYKAQEKPQMSDQEFHAQDDFRITLQDFKERFGPAR